MVRHRKVSRLSVTTATAHWIPLLERTGFLRTTSFQAGPVAMECSTERSTRTATYWFWEVRQTGISFADIPRLAFRMPHLTLTLQVSLRAGWIPRPYVYNQTE